MTRPLLPLALMGAGDIAARYAGALSLWPGLKVAAIAGRTAEGAEPLARQFGAEACGLEALMADPNYPFVINLTPPKAHARVTQAALTAGKRVYSEKPLAATMEDALGLLAQMDRIACAPAVHLSPAVGALRDLIEDGALGRVIGATATIVYPGPDQWHANPEALFDEGAGPLFDMGVYPISVLVALLGPVARVRGVGRRAHDYRDVRLGPRAGQRFSVAVSTHVAAILEFGSGPTATLTASFDGFASKAPGLEIFGEAGAVALPWCDPLTTRYWRAESPLRWREEQAPARAEAYWAIGVLEALSAWSQGLPPRTQAGFALHVLECLVAITQACETGEAQTLTTRCAPPAPFHAVDLAAITAAFGPPLHRSAA